LALCWADLNLSWAYLGLSWAICGLFLAFLGVSWACLGMSWTIVASLGPILGCLGLSRASLAPVLGCLGLDWPPLDLSWADLVLPLPSLGSLFGHFRTALSHNLGTKTLKMTTVARFHSLTRDTFRYL
jgi:hypothetical protein